MLLRKRDLYRLVDFIDDTSISAEVSEKLDSLARLFDEAVGPDGPDADS